MPAPRDIDTYLAALPEHARSEMLAIRAAIHAAVPGATEGISYQMPTFRLHDKALIHVAAWKKHIGIYPAPDGDDDLLAALAPFAAEKGTLRFPLDAPMPLDLIARVATARALQLGSDDDGSGGLRA